MSLFNELKRRNVFRIGIAYTVATWLLIQVADTVFPRIGLPDTAVTLVIALLAIGFIPALIFAWAFEMTPEGLKREKDVDRKQSITPQTGRKLDRMIIGIMAIVIAFLVVDRFVLKDQTEAGAPVTELQTASSEAATETSEDSGPSVAVMPFVNMSGDADNEYFSDGLTETLLHMLAQLPELRVAARTSSFSFKGKDAGIGEISQALNVAHILEGSVQKAGNRVRITAQLIRAEDGFHVWSQNYDRTLEDIFAIQDEIATDVAGMLDATLLEGDTGIAHIDTSDVGAYDTYLRAMEQQAIGSYGSLSSAESLFKQALGIDPGFIDAKLGLARNYYMQFNTGLIDETQMQEAVRPLLDQVREVHPDNRLARVIELLTQYHVFSFDDVDTLRTVADELRLLLPLLPSETYIRGQVATMVAYGLHEPQVALEIIDSGLMVDPLSADLYAQQGNVFNQMERYESARDAFLKAVELDPLNPNHYSRMAFVSGELGDITAAFQWRLKNIEADPQDHESIGHMARDFYEWGLPEEGDRWMNAVRVLAPNSDILQRLQVERALSRGDTDELIAVAQKMIAAPASMRQNAFPTALFSYRQQMSKAGRSREAYDFLAGLRPEITSFEQLPDDLHGTLMQWASIELMSGFRSPEERKADWEKFTENLRMKGPWWFEEPNAQATNFLFIGDLDSAIEKAQEDLAQPLSSWPTRAKAWDDPMFAPITANPQIAARLSEMKREKQQAREQIREMLQGPEWNQ
jgi:TolB-like protein/cytochrome c-type biogenesis protein CcmH/NrfG